MFVSNTHFNSLDWPLLCCSAPLAPSQGTSASPEDGRDLRTELEARQRSRELDWNIWEQEERGAYTMIMGITYMSKRRKREERRESKIELLYYTQISVRIKYEIKSE